MIEMTSFKSNIVSVTIFEIFATKIPDLDLGRFKVTKVHGANQQRTSGFLFDFY